MPGIAKTRRTIAEKAVLEMEEAGIYKAQYDRIIDVYALAFEQYYKLLKEFRMEDYKARSPLALSLENLRKDVLAYSAQLGLTPAGLKKITGEKMGRKKQSKLEKALKQIES